MDVLFIDPPWIIESDTNLWKTVGSCLPSLGMAYIASYLEKRGYKVKILDCNCERVPVSDIGKRLRQYEKPKFIGITATSALINNALSVAKICKDVFPDSVVVMGGVHPSVMPDDTLANSQVDLVVRDEGEVTMAELVAGKKYADIDGLSFREKTKVRHNPDRALIKDLNEIPPPAYHLLPMKKYYPATGSYKRLPAMSIFATRGCPGRCTFCYRTFYGKVRKRSTESIISEIELLQRDFGIKEIAFYDDTFTCFRKEVERFVDTLLRKKIDITWSCFTRPDHVDSGLLRIMKRGGCHLILFGVESADEEILKNINKRISLSNVKEMTRQARKIGIETRASFMLGNPGETEDTVRKTIRFALELDPDEAQFNIATAYPGTELYKWAQENGFLDVRDNKNFNMSDINMKLPTISRAVLDKYYKISHRSFYLRPMIMMRRLLHIRSFVQLKQEIKGLVAILRFIIKRP